MQIGRVIGKATATVKHPDLHGWKLLLVQPLASDGSDDGDPLLALDQLGAGLGDLTIISSDGASVRKMVGSNTCPARWAVIGIADRSRWSRGEAKGRQLDTTP